jgi:thiol:disulfide interchange protein DsbD
MKNLLKATLVIIVLLLAAKPGIAQMVQDPTGWSYEVKKKSGNTYELIFHLKLQKDWHIWAMKPGGDGYQVPPTFRFDKVAGVQCKGAPVEKGKAITANMEGIDGKVTYFTSGLDYVQTVVVTAKNVTITGSHEYQVCNDHLCLPPKKKTFRFEIKG